MSKLNITTTGFDHTYYSKEKCGNTAYGYYERHNIDVYNEIIVNGIELSAIYQTGCSYLHNDYDCPNPELELSKEGGASEILLLVDTLRQSDFDDNNEDVHEVLEMVKERLPCIDDINKLHELYVALNENHPGGIVNYI